MFFRLLEESAQEARNSVQALVRFSKTWNQEDVLKEFANVRWKDKEITQEIRKALYTTFITALEREDIEALSEKLYKIPKTVEKFTERIVMAPAQARGVAFAKQINLLERATDVVLEMVKALHRGGDLDEIKNLNDRLQTLEGDADKLMLDLYRELYNGKHDPIMTLVLKDLYELLEKVIDRCRDAGTVMSHIALKNS